MLKIGIRQICLTMAACLFGAGFVSGQELWQFFGSFGTKGLICMAASGLLLALLAFMTVRFAAIYDTAEMDRIVIPFNSKLLVNIAGGIELSFMFCIYVIMTAGAGTLIENLSGSTGLRVLCSCVFCAAVTAVALKGIGRAVKIFGLVVPIMVTVAVIISVGITAKNGLPELHIEPQTTGNPLISNPIVSMLTFVSYNFFCAIGSLASVGKYAASAKRAAAGSLLGGLLLTAVAFFIVLAILAVPGSENAELPLLSLAGSIHISTKYIVAVTLLIAMFGASLSVFVPIPEYLNKFRFTFRHNKLCTALLSLAALLLSLFGFSDLIGVIYPIYGYIAFAAIAGLTVNYFKAVKHKNRPGKY